MREPSLRTSRLAIAGALIAALAVGGAGFFLGRTTSSQQTPSAPSTAATATPPTSSFLPEAEPILTRSDIIELANLAADAAATGIAPPARVREAADRRFELAVPFGCFGAAGEDSAAPLRWRYDDESEALRVHVAVTAWTASDWALSDADPIEAIEGFWVTRPWSSGRACPPQSDNAENAQAETATAARQTLAVAQFFRGDVRREALREGRPFQLVKRVPGALFAARDGLRLVLSGRIERVPGTSGPAPPVHCIQPDGIAGRPVCVVAVALDQVRVENPASGEILASWPIVHD